VADPDADTVWLCELYADNQSRVAVQGMDLDADLGRHGQDQRAKARARNSSAAWSQTSCGDPSGQPLACQSSLSKGGDVIMSDCGDSFLIVAA
jgi:hypothetical protein